MVKNTFHDAGRTGSIPGLGRPPGGGNGSPLQDSGLGNLSNGGAWGATVHGFAKGSDTAEQLNVNSVF